MTKITLGEIKKVANLARLQLSEKELETFTVQLEKILDYVDHLQQVDTKNVTPTTRAVEVVNVLREDLSVQTSVREELLNQSPQREGDFYKVPKILSE